jgi:hypothetical protein
MTYCRGLKFEEKPDYNHLRRMFKDLFNRMGYEYDYNYDWTLLEKKVRKKIVRKPMPESGSLPRNF